MIFLMFGNILLNFSTSEILGLFAIFGFEVKNLLLLLLLLVKLFSRKTFFVTANDKRFL